MGTRLNGDIAQKVLVYSCCALVAAAWGFMTSRASSKDVEKNEQAIEEVKKDTNKRLKGLETNVIKTCQFLDRMDKNAGGPGLGCKDPE